MNTKEYLLACLAEEANELGQAAIKALRFGLDDINPHTKIQNTEAIITEIADIMGVMELIQDYNFEEFKDLRIKGNDFSMRVIKKKMKLQEYMKYSRSRGTLT